MTKASSVLTAAAVSRELTGYRLKLVVLGDRFKAGERGIVAAEAQDYADALICLMAEAPLPGREKIDYLINRFESLCVAASS